jgi:hypothetical protein
MGDRVFSRERSREPASQLTSSLFLAKARREPSGTNLKMLQDAHTGPRLMF